MEVTAIPLTPKKEKSLYFNLKDINDLQTEIMEFVDMWVRKEKTPVPQKTIIISMVQAGVKEYTVVGALKALLKKGYIRRSSNFGKETRYVQLRSI